MGSLRHVGQDFLVMHCFAGALTVCEYEFKWSILVLPPFRWYRVIIKGILRNGFLSVYELDYGKHEFVSVGKVQPLLDTFRRLPFQAITAQLAGRYQAFAIVFVKVLHQWAYEVNRNVKWKKVKGYVIEFFLHVYVLLLFLA